MARRGFVALVVDYDNSGAAWLSDHVAQRRCLFDVSEQESLLATACALPNVDCALGIATWGHSQGAFLAHIAGNDAPSVRAAWTTGYGGDAVATLPKERLRVVNAEGDFGNGSIAMLNQIAGFSAGECPDDGRKECLRDDGSGWIRVLASDCEISSADHCWFTKVMCLDASVRLEPRWVDPDSDATFALEKNADWVASTVRRR
jgi:hypothetical protein